MLVALLVAFLLGGGSGTQVFSKADQHQVKTVITDEVRAKKAVKLMKATDKAASDQMARTAKLVKGWSKQDRDHGAGRDQLDPVLAELVDVRAESQAEFLDRLFELRETMSRQEWDQVMNRDRSSTTESGGSP